MTIVENYTLPSNDFDASFREGDVGIEFLENRVVPPRVVPAINFRQNVDAESEAVVLVIQFLQVVTHHYRSTITSIEVHSHLRCIRRELLRELFSPGIC